MTDILEFGLLEVIEEPNGLVFTVGEEEIFLDRGEVRQLLAFLAQVVGDWDREWN